MISSLKSMVRRLLRHYGYELISVQASLPKEVRADYDLNPR